MTVSDFEIALVRLCPIIVIVPSGLRGTLSAPSISKHGIVCLFLQRTFDRKSIPMVAWYILSNESYIKRVIRDVFPTMSSSCSAR